VEGRRDDAPVRRRRVLWISLTSESGGSLGREVLARNVTVRLTRRTLLATGAAAGSALALPRAVLPARKTLPVFKLDPCNGTDCVACGACQNYDKYVFFPTEKHADGNRVHIGCNCGIVQGTLERGTYIALFGNPDTGLTRFVADQRDPVVQALIKNHPPSF
jgi:hypothetical protein